MSTALDVLTHNLTLTVKANARRNQSGIAPAVNSTTINKPLAWTKGAAVAGGEDQLCSIILNLTASGTADVDLTSIKNVVGETVTLARLKSILIELLSPKDDSSLGTLCSGITFGPETSMNNGFVGFFGANGNTIALPGGSATVEGGVFLWATRNAAGYVVDSTHKKLLFTNVDGAVAANVRITIGGANS
jgi:hypothetical protein